jgi:sugar lactone lactonase YvrE
MWHAAQHPAEDTGDHKPPNVTFVLQWGSPGDGPGQFHSPIGMAFAPRDEIVVTDVNNSRVQRFSTSGRFLSQFHLPRDTGERNQSVAGGIAVRRDGLVYVAFMQQHCIRAFTPKGEWVLEFGRAGSAPGEFRQPGGLLFGPDGCLYVADQCNHRVQVFTPEGHYLRMFGKHGFALGEFGGPEPAGSRFAGPHLICLDAVGNICTTEGTHCRVQRITRQGVGINGWGDNSDAPGGFGSRSSKAAGLKGPIGICCDHQGRIWVSSLNDRVQCFSPNGRHLLTLGGITGDQPGRFARPHSLLADRQGYLYVADAGNQRIQKFRLKDGK